MAVNLLQRIAAAAAAFASPSALPAARPFREAVGVTVDSDESEWRPLTGDPTRDLSPLTQARMQELALYQWQSNLLANRLIELPLAYLLAEGVRLTVPDEEAQGWLDAFWRDPINRMDRKLAKKVRELAIYGEQCWPAFVNEVSGHMRLGYLDPGVIATVVTDPDNAEQPIGIVTKVNRKGEKRRYRIVANGPEDIFTPRTQAIRESFADGECFFFSVNELSNGARGRSDLFAQIDWLDAYEQFLFGQVERGNLLRSFIWDVTLKGATPEEVEARAKKIATPRPASVRVHNDAEAWQALAPDLSALDSTEQARLFRNHILGGGTVPEHWYGGGGDVNRATALSMGEPTFKMFSARQATLRYILEEVGTYAIRRRLLAKAKPDLDPAAPDPNYAVKAEFPELAARDIAGHAAALQQVAIAAAQAIDKELLSEETAVRLIAIVAGRLGVDVDPMEELKQARADALRRAEDDTIVELPEDTP